VKIEKTKDVKQQGVQEKKETRASIYTRAHNDIGEVRVETTIQTRVYISEGE